MIQLFHKIKKFALTFVSYGFMFSEEVDAEEHRDFEGEPALAWDSFELLLGEL